MASNGPKLALATIAFAIWGWTLLSTYFNPSEVPAWAQEQGSARKVLLLDTDFSPTIFTLYMGIVASAITLIGMYRLLSGFMHQAGEPLETMSSFAVAPARAQKANHAPTRAHSPQPEPPVFGRRTQAAPEGFMQQLHDLDAYATWQGGFEYYFDHVDGDDWPMALLGLESHGLNVAAKAFREAQRMFLSQPDEGYDGAAADEFSAAMEDQNRRWRTEVPMLHDILKNWRAARGLEEFGRSGW